MSEIESEIKDRSSITRALNSAAAMILRSAHNRIAEHGWTQGVAYDARTGRVDILGAVAIGALIHPKALPPDATETILATAPLSMRGGAYHAWEALDATLHMSPVEWNDEPHRTISDVLRVLDALAISLAAAS